MSPSLVSFGKRFGNGGGVTNAVLECMQEAGESTDGIKVARCNGAVECKKACLCCGWASCPRTSWRVWPAWAAAWAAPASAELRTSLKRTATP